MVGGAIFGGPLGFVSALANIFVEETTGKDVGEHIVALAGFGPEENAPDATESTAPLLASDSRAEKPSATITAVAAAIAPAPTSQQARKPSTAAAVPVAAAEVPSSPHSVQPGALAKYQTTAWGALIAAQQANGANNQNLLRPLPMPVSALAWRSKTGAEAGPAGASAVPTSVSSLSASSSSPVWQIENLSAQELAERLLLYSKAFEANGKSRNAVADKAY